MDVWRICRRRFARRPLSGAGGLHASARWHSAPRLIVYASQSLALASLEMLVHVDLDLPPDDLLALQIAVPADIAQAELRPAQLPRFWRRYPAPKALQSLGNAWLDQRETAVLRVPSALIPGEFNYLINPQHPDARHIRVVDRSRFTFDPRLIRTERG